MAFSRCSAVLSSGIIFFSVSIVNDPVRAEEGNEMLMLKKSKIPNCPIHDSGALRQAAEFFTSYSSGANETDRLLFQAKNHILTQLHLLDKDKSVRNGV